MKHFFSIIFLSASLISIQCYPHENETLLSDLPHEQIDPTVVRANGTFENLTVTNIAHFQGPVIFDGSVDLNTTNHAVQVGNATGGLKSLPVATNGQLIIGRTGNDPLVGNLGTTNGITKTVGAGTLSITGVDATTSAKGVVELATNAETIAGTDATRAVTPASLGAKLGAQTQFGVLYGGGPTGAVGATNVGTSGYVLTSNGASAPSFQPPTGGGVASVTAGSNISVTGTASNPIVNVVDSPSFNDSVNMLDQNALRLFGNIGFVGLQAPATVPSNYTLAFPTTAPTASQVMRANATTPSQLEWISPASFVSPTISRSVYVAKYGNDTTGDGSLNAPYLTLSKAITVANSISTTANPVAIVMNSGVYTENNSAGPLTITAGGISVVGNSPTATIISPSTLSNTLISTTTGARFVDLGFVASGVSTATGISFAGVGNTSNFTNVRVANFNVGVSCAGTNGTYLMNYSVFVNNGTGISINSATAVCTDFTIQGGTVSPANIGLSANGGQLLFSGGLCTLCATGVSLTNNTAFNARGAGFRNNNDDVIQTTGASSQFNGCTFQLNTSTGTTIQAADAGTFVEIIGTYFNGKDGSGNPQGTAIKITDEATATMTGSQIEYYQTAIQLGEVTDTSSTLLQGSAVFIKNCDTSDITQNGSTTLNFVSSTASSSKISINDPTNVKIALFDIENNDHLRIGAFADTNLDLIEAAIATADNPKINYVPSLYSSQAIGYTNEMAQPSSWFAQSPDNTALTAITTDRTKTAGLRLVSDTANPVGGTTALRGWDMQKNGSAASLAFSYQNSDTVGQSAVAAHDVVIVDGVNNQLQLPTTDAQLIFASDTNLYRGAANTLKTDDNFIVGGLTASRALATNGSKQLTSAATTATELDYLSGVTSAIQPQLDTKLSTTGGTLTGSLQLPAGSSASPSLNFTGSATTGLSASSDNLSLNTGGNERMKISSSGSVSINEFGVAGVVHNNSSGVLTSSLITNADVSASAAIADGKLATISTAGKVANSATTATSANTANAIVARDGSGNFSAGTITANLVGNVTGAASLNVLKSGDTMTGTLNLTPSLSNALTATGVSGSATVAITPHATSKGITIATTTGNALEVNSDKFTVVGSTGDTAVGGTLNVTGATTLSNLSTTGLVHATGGLLSSSLLVNADVAAGAAIVDTKLATISTAGKVANSATTATSANTANTIVLRDGSGNFSAGTITVNAGSSAAPSLQFNGSTNTGLSAAVANTLSLDTNGTQRMSISTTDITTIARLVLTNLICNQALQTNNVTATGQTTIANSTTSILRLTLTAGTVAGHTVTFPATPTDGQLFTIMLGNGAPARISTLTNSTGAASLVNPITRLDPAAGPAQTTATASVTYIYNSATTTWYRYGIG